MRETKGPLRVIPIIIKWLAIGLVLFLVELVLIRSFEPVTVINRGYVFGVGEYRLVVWVLVLLMLLRLRTSRPGSFFTGLIITAGGVNLMERLTFGGVVDYFNFLGLRFNLMDILITMAAAGLTWQALKIK